MPFINFRTPINKKNRKTYNPVRLIKKLVHRIHITHSHSAQKNELRHQIFDLMRAGSEHEEGYALRIAASRTKRWQFDQHRREHQKNEGFVCYGGSFFYIPTNWEGDRQVDPDLESGYNGGDDSCGSDEARGSDSEFWTE